MKRETDKLPISWCRISTLNIARSSGKMSVDIESVFFNT